MSILLWETLYVYVPLSSCKAKGMMMMLMCNNMQVSLNDILEHFNGSTKEGLVDLLGCLESEFLIFRKKDLYMLM